jgi:signal transduction histidine kinase
MRSLLYKILISSLLIILLPMGVAIHWTSNTLSTLLERRFAEKSRAQTEHVKLLLKEKQDTAAGLAHWLAEIPGVKEKLKKRDRNALFQLLLPVVGSIEMDFIEILDREGKIFLRVHDPSRYGDMPPLTRTIQGLLRGMRDLPSYGVEERDHQAYLRAAEGIDDQGVIMGVVSAGYSLNRDFIMELEQAAGGRVVIGIGERRYAASEIVKESPVVAGKLPERGDRNEIQWHRDGPSPVLEIRIPLETDQGKQGIISLFFPSQEMTAAIGALQKALLSISLLGIALACSMSWILSRRLTRPLKDLVKGTEEVAAGNYAGAVRATTRDEIGTLAASFNRMLEELRRSKAEVESYRQELERKFAERSKELAETEKKRAAMAHMIAHDLKNPLLGIKKTLERLEHIPPEVEGAQRRKIRQDLLNASDLVIGMVNEMLDIYRSDFGDLPLSLAPLRVEELIQASLRILGPELEEKRIEVVTHVDPPHISLVADKRRLTRLLINLISNAIKFSPQDRRIYLSTSLAEPPQSNGVQVAIRIEDEGTGIPEPDLPRIFDAFYSRDQGELEAGTGLGLPYCKLVAESHGGKIWAENRRGGGLAVSIALPAHLEAEQQSYAH